MMAGPSAGGRGPGASVFRPTVIAQAWADIAEGASSSVAFARAVFADDTLRRLFDAAFAHAIAVQGGPRDPMEWETVLLRLAARARLNSTRKLPGRTLCPASTGPRK